MTTFDQKTKGLPVTSNVAPVIYRLLSDAKNTQASAISIEKKEKKTITHLLYHNMIFYVLQVLNKRKKKTITHLLYHNMIFYVL